MGRWKKEATLGKIQAFVDCHVGEVLTQKEVAEGVGIGERTVQRYWDKIRFGAKTADVPEECPFFLNSHKWERQNPMPTALDFAFFSFSACSKCYEVNSCLPKMVHSCLLMLIQVFPFKFPSIFHKAS